VLLNDLIDLAMECGFFFKLEVVLGKFLSMPPETLLVLFFFCTTSFILLPLPLLSRPCVFFLECLVTRIDSFDVGE